MRPILKVSDVVPIPPASRGLFSAQVKLCRIIDLVCRQYCTLVPDSSDNFTFLSARHFRAARVLLDWTQDELARNARVVRRTIVMLETGGCRTQPRNVRAVLAALQAGGVRFTSVDGEVSLTDANSGKAEVPAPLRRGAGRIAPLRTRVSGRRPVAV